MNLPSGMSGRWAYGMVILVHVMVYNETGGPTTVLSLLIATGCALLSANCKSSLAHVQLPYLRATQRFDFFCLFLAVWMDLLALMATCGALARTLSTCLDAMSGGMARIYLLGRNSPENEPWPDVLGVSVVFLLTVMFMLGLENTKVFGLLMTVGVLGLTIIIATVSGLRGRADEWKSRTLLPRGLVGLLSSAALTSYSFPTTISSNGVAFKRCLGVLHVFVVGAALAFSTGCLSTITHLSDHDYIAVPILPLLEKQDFHTFQPAVACLLVLACSGAYLELFPEMYSIIVQLTTVEWKILPRQIGYESTDSGSPVLAIFTGASLCAMFAFACPLQNLLYIMAASHLVASILRAAYLLYSPLRPKFMITSTNDSTSAYSRLDITASAGSANKSNPTTTSRSSSIWGFLSKPKSMSLLPTSKSMLKKSKRNEELEREWLLLGEPPQSPRLPMGGSAMPEAAEESSISGPSRGVGLAPLSDVECLGSGKEDGLSDEESAESTTDIDAIVDEYRQKVKVSTAGPMEKIIRLPTAGSWQLTLVLMALILVGLIAASLGAVHNSSTLFISGVVAILVLCISMTFLPKYVQGPASISAFTCGLAILIETVLLASTLSYSWPAILFWVFAAVALFLRCDKWCCACFDHPRRSRQMLIQTNASAPNMTSIRIPCPPRGSMISSRISGHR